MAEVNVCECGCGKKTSKIPHTDKNRGFIKGNYARFVWGHNRRKKESEMYSVDQNSGCWIWLLGTSSGRYGMIDGKTAHTLFYEKYKGPVPQGLILDHLCRVPLCVNPDHLEAVTQALNVQRGALAKLTAYQVKEIRRRVSMNISKDVLAKEYGVTTSNIYLVSTGRSWKSIPMESDGMISKRWQK